MSDRELKLAQLRTQLTLAEQRKKTAELVLKTPLNQYALEDAKKAVEASAFEVENLKQQIVALEKSE